MMRTECFMITIYIFIYIYILNIYIYIYIYIHHALVDGFVWCNPLIFFNPLIVWNNPFGVGVPYSKKPGR